MTYRQRFIHPTVHSLVALAVLTVLVLGVSACQPRVQMVRPGLTLSPLSAATVTPAPHNVALVGVDFDPPLSGGRLLGSGLTMLVAVQNQGLTAEPTVSVSARLLDPVVSDGQPGDLLHETVTVHDLEPGEVRVVRFAEVTDLPARDRYQLVVELEHVEGDADLSDNARTYDVLVGDEE